MKRTHLEPLPLLCVRAIWISPQISVSLESNVCIVFLWHYNQIWHLKQKKCDTNVCSLNQVWLYFWNSLKFFEIFWKVNFSTYHSRNEMEHPQALISLFLYIFRNFVHSRYIYCFFFYVIRKINVSKLN